MIWAIICGGFYESMSTQCSNKCFILGVNHTITMANERSYASSISISRDKVSSTFLMKFVLPQVIGEFVVVSQFIIFLLELLGPAKQL